MDGSGASTGRAPPDPTEYALLAKERGTFDRLQKALVSMLKDDFRIQELRRDVKAMVDAAWPTGVSDPLELRRRVLAQVQRSIRSSAIAPTLAQIAHSVAVSSHLADIVENNIRQTVEDSWAEAMVQPPTTQGSVHSTGDRAASARAESSPASPHAPSGANTGHSGSRIPLNPPSRAGQNRNVGVNLDEGPANAAVPSAATAKVTTLHAAEKGDAGGGADERTQAQKSPSANKGIQENTNTDHDVLVTRGHEEPDNGAKALISEANRIVSDDASENTAARQSARKRKVRLHLHNAEQTDRGTNNKNIENEERKLSIRLTKPDQASASSSADGSSSSSDDSEEDSAGAGSAQAASPASSSTSGSIASGSDGPAEARSNMSRSHREAAGEDRSGRERKRRRT